MTTTVISPITWTDRTEWYRVYHGNFLFSADTAPSVVCISVEPPLAAVIPDSTIWVSIPKKYDGVEIVLRKESTDGGPVTCKITASNSKKGSVLLNSSEKSNIVHFTRTLVAGAMMVFSLYTIEQNKELSDVYTVTIMTRPDEMDQQ